MAKGKFRITDNGIPVVGWPGILGDISRLLGDGAAESFARAFGDGKLYIPKVKKLKDGHPLVKTLGREAAITIAAAMGGREYPIPTARWSLSHHRVRVFRSKGWGVKAIAKALALRITSVERLCQGMEEPVGAPEPVTVRCYTCDQLHTFNPADIRKPQTSELDQALDAKPCAAIGLDRDADPITEPAEADRERLLVDSEGATRAAVPNEG
ncbi:hypothetical protein [Azospirillum agricola]|uniref:hypothetical protein n=1 Tax=Azospirillum agricola TaxID=1720247 RepID=UPI001177E938|nr:hypothetical protein [Azospirillum agricola]